MTTHHQAQDAAPLAFLPRALRRWYLEFLAEHYIDTAAMHVETARTHNDAAEYYLSLAVDARRQLDCC